MDALGVIAEYAIMADFITRNYQFYWELSSTESQPITTDCCRLHMGVLSSRGEIELYTVQLSRHPPWWDHVGCMKFDQQKIIATMIGRMRALECFKSCTLFDHGVIVSLVCREIEHYFLSGGFDELLARTRGCTTDDRSVRDILIPREDIAGVAANANPATSPNEVLWHYVSLTPFGKTDPVFRISVRDVFGLLPIAHISVVATSDKKGWCLKLCGMDHELEDSPEIPIFTDCDRGIATAVDSAIMPRYRDIVFKQIIALISHAIFDGAYTTVDITTFMTEVLGASYVPEIRLVNSQTQSF